MMGCLFACFRASGGDGEVKGTGGQLAHPSQPPATTTTTSHQVQDGAGRRARPPSRNALSAVFQREDEGSRTAQVASSWADESGERKEMDQELVHQAIIQRSCGALLQTTNNIQGALIKYADSVHQKETHSGCLPVVSDDLHFMEAPKVEKCETPSRSHQSFTVPDATSSSKTNDELQTSATSLANNVKDSMNENNMEALVQDEEQHQALDLEECGVSKEESFHPEKTEEPKCAKNHHVVSMEISISDECSLFQSSEGSVPSSYKIRESMNTTSVEKSPKTEATIHATRKKLPKSDNSELELPSLAQWLKPPNPKKTFRDEAMAGDRSHSGKSSDEDRPIIGMVAAHWKDKVPLPANFTSKLRDGNGIPNSTNKYKEDQKVSWHATPFEERLEKALSEEKLLSERSCSSGKTSQFLGVEGEESDMAESNRLYTTAYACQFSSASHEPQKLSV
ncbi:Protein JASON [Zea mays]|uniref:Protein JASON n=1 Tax=Zea mays TaxID=4577 RepID=C0HEV9_MAIZE|nr:unknown [Zea mays]ONM09915.1 Protein JASON [Zea mays]